ncbi:hypothetical protein V8E53_014036, partial [Lactarius tabidus]
MTMLLLDQIFRRIKRLDTCSNNRTGVTCGKCTNAEGSRECRGNSGYHEDKRGNEGRVHCVSPELRCIERVWSGRTLNVEQRRNKQCCCENTKVGRMWRRTRSWGSSFDARVLYNNSKRARLKRFVRRTQPPVQLVRLTASSTVTVIWAGLESTHAGIRLQLQQRTATGNLFLKIYCNSKGRWFFEYSFQVGSPTGINRCLGGVIRL